MNTLRIIKIYTCSECPFRCYSDGIMGNYYYCDKIKKELTNFLHADPNTLDGKRNFPEWCPLEVYVDK